MLKRVGLAAALIGSLVLASGPAPAQEDWSPDQRHPFDIQLTSPFNLVRPVDLIELDLFGTSPEQIKALKAKGVRTVCSISAGTSENWRMDAREYPQALIGRAYEGWSNERWLDIRDQDALLPILEKRLQLCQKKGFDAVDFGKVDGYAHETGFPLTAKDQIAFNRRLAKTAARYGLKAALRNGLELVPELVQDFDFAIAESCFTDNRCEPLKAFREADKPVYVVEYTNVRRKMARFCQEAAELDVQLLFKTKSLNGKLHARCP
jgi:endo-alpha-1,4-polygalactosaminidase (GH114 family)